MFTIHRITPRYCQITDAMIGSSARPERSYLTQALAHKIAGRLAQADYDTYGDDGFVVTRAGGCPYRDCLSARPVAADASSHYDVALLDDEIPF